jgi:hypothetical protein
VKVSVRDIVAALKKQSKSLHEKLALRLTAAVRRKWVSGFMSQQMSTLWLFKAFETANLI